MSTPTLCAQPFALANALARIQARENDTRRAAEAAADRATVRGLRRDLRRLRWQGRCRRVASLLQAIGTLLPTGIIIGIAIGVPLLFLADWLLALLWT